MPPVQPVEFSRELATGNNQRCGNRVQLEDDSGAAINAANPLDVDIGASIAAPVFVEEVGVYTFGAIQTVNVGLVAVQLVAANANRRALIIANNGAQAVVISFGNGVGLTAAIWTYYIPPFNSLPIDPPLTQQAVWAISVAGANNVSYQEAV